MTQHSPAPLKRERFERVTAATLFICDVRWEVFKGALGGRTKLGWAKLACQGPFVISFCPLMAHGKGPSFGAARRTFHRRTG